MAGEGAARRAAEENAQVVQELELARAVLMEQAAELEAQAAELEAQTEELHCTVAELERRNEELRQRTREAESARAEAEAANQAKAEFLATMSHELRTPLNAIAGYTQILELGIHGPVTDQQLDTLARIRHNKRRLLALINDILNFTRIRAGRLPVEVARISVTELLAGMEPLVAPQVRTRGVMMQISKSTPGTVVLADRERAEQVLLNLLSNAIKFTQPGGRIDVRSDMDASHVRIHVADTGRGIPADRLEAIFDPFVQVDTRHSRDVDGVGLGLSISRDLARAMGGDITVRSEPARGSIFTFLLRRPADAAGGAVSGAVQLPDASPGRSDASPGLPG